jgi:hypothetical protein
MKNVRELQKAYDALLEQSEQSVKLLLDAAITIQELREENAELKEEVKHLNEISNSIYSDLQDSINK